MLVDGKHYRTVWFEDDKVKMIDQRILPNEFKIVELANVNEVADAIRNMIVRGAPAIGATGAYGIALATIRKEGIRESSETLRKTRPTAYDLFHGIEYVLKEMENKKDPLKASETYANLSIEACKKIGEHGASLIKDGFRILTHCNAGWLACVDWGTALSPIYFAKRQRKQMFVYVDETRPRLQGARLTSWELMNEEISHSVIADNAAGHFMRTKEIDLVIVGADRVAKNGDFANKIGTYEKAVLAKENGIPFYVAAPRSTIDLSCESGEKIPIEEREEDEVHFVGNERVTPDGSKARNPAFDVTPSKFVTGVITEKGILKPGKIRKTFS
ncbi:MAG: S-methyl-5-thioribose-1-phosphate isomerase [Candidatus Aenigmarchaeota archaeon]|nr:S-methyl-5-thioribose-1-phosphate isomerase [Candidatus Aenigmarchaeota archaeon]